ncbi:predicted protein [Sclerotinia sclerotiorum 1980 UF-70]|uniref:Uncharacterized protein n=2 Tax=Sclerotinia sclerotiorum (strain ATCC 18683 / 1980 / Ss-1) TaxID=665079 RepID=A7E819_SCLS1|nr:predicted protein [Sclerotinia sclerotiorum 1980 UF-70]APA06109.1 hypothetical protein sscle_01g008790 [Sclerotinia sclerotiorum 1980 UF-70]EDN96521.1 predicted protein [Sclerotinia sclerotiorum 1980 UF-70]
MAKNLLGYKLPSQEFRIWPAKKERSPHNPQSLVKHRTLKPTDSDSDFDSIKTTQSSLPYLHLSPLIP